MFFCDQYVFCFQCYELLGVGIKGVGVIVNEFGFKVIGGDYSGDRNEQVGKGFDQVFFIQGIIVFCRYYWIENYWDICIVL